MNTSHIANIVSNHQKYFIAIAYNMVGDMEVAKDIVQDAYIKTIPFEENIKHRKAYLRKTVVNLCIDHLNHLKKHPKSYVGPQLATPVEDTFWEDELKDNKSIDQALFLLFNKLTPYERAVLVLKNLYGTKHAEIASIINTTEEESRQIYSRLKRKIKRLPDQKTIALKTRKKVIDQFIYYINKNDLEGLKSLLKNDIKYYVDSGGKVKGAATNILTGSDTIAEFIISRLQKITPKVTCYKIKYINGKLNIVNVASNKIRLFIELEVVENKIANIYITANPDKLKYISL
ncbi:sigma-70 family RNA polymerase sigma factor [Leptobacterium sp. I13]|uniref:sigma-70 family RNA polymerase sigma factor n=1 Tax=Leptobacterium meishanense TaxID=3128904 RepID=UPI0030EC6F11